MSIKNKKNYANGKIYQITSHAGDKIYIGSSTKRLLSQRMDMHRGKYKQWKVGKPVSMCMCFDMFDEYGLENCKIILIELFPCTSFDELTAREAHFIRTLKCVNKVIPGRTRQEYIEVNKDNISEYMKQYRKDNRDKISEQKKHYYEANKEVISQKAKLEYTCECGTKCRNDSKTKHFRTIKHLKYMKQKPISI